MCGPSAIGSALFPVTLELYEGGRQILGGLRIHSDNRALGQMLNLKYGHSLGKTRIVGGVVPN